MGENREEGVETRRQGYEPQSRWRRVNGHKVFGTSIRSVPNDECNAGDSRGMTEALPPGQESELAKHWPTASRRPLPIEEDVVYKHIAVPALPRPETTPEIPPRPYRSQPAPTGGEVSWKPVGTSWVNCRLWITFPAMYPPITFGAHLECNLNI